MDPIIPPLTPWPLFKAWYQAATLTEPVDPMAMTIATLGSDGWPDLRTVYLRGHDQRGFVFYTNTLSKKGRDLEANPRLAANFYWAHSFRQIRLRGVVELVSPAEADDYFANRPRDNQIGAWASRQSDPLPDRDALLAEIEAVKARFGDDQPVPRPPHWSGYRIVPNRFEFWLGHPSRWHDRVVYTLDPTGTWEIGRVFP